MIEETRPKDDSAPHGPTVPVGAVVDADSGKPVETATSTVGDESFVAAFRVTRNADGDISVMTPLMGPPGAEFGFCIAERVADDVFERIHRLPIKDLANPGIALVVRKSLERLVLQARVIVGPEGFRLLSAEHHAELKAALEPFAEVAP